MRFVKCLCGMRSFGSVKSLLGKGWKLSMTCRGGVWLCKTCKDSVSLDVDSGRLVVQRPDGFGSFEKWEEQLPDGEED